MRIRVVKTTDREFKLWLKRILERRGHREGEVEKRVDEIVRAVKRKGDAALLIVHV